MGVWIETAYRCGGLSDILVTPFVGVWIETQWVPTLLRVRTVTPFVGVWIETIVEERIYN